MTPNSLLGNLASTYFRFKEFSNFVRNCTNLCRDAKCVSQLSFSCSVNIEILILLKSENDWETHYSIKWSVNLKSTFNHLNSPKASVIAKVSIPPLPEIKIMRLFNMIHVSSHSDLKNIYKNEICSNNHDNNSYRLARHPKLGFRLWFLRHIFAVNISKLEIINCGNLENREQISKLLNTYAAKEI